jgi:hypothetical protein
MADLPSDPNPATAPHAGLPREEGSRLIHIGIASFLACGIAGGVIATQCSPRAQDQPRNAVAEVAKVQRDGTFQATLDTRDSDRWVEYDFSAGRPAHAGQVSDIHVRRYVIRAPLGAVDLGTVALADAEVPPNATWTRDSVDKGELQNPLLSSWYQYSYWSHELSTKGRTYAVRLASAKAVAYMRVESYGCEPKGAGCMTIRYRLALGESDGT